VYWRCRSRMEAKLRARSPISSRGGARQGAAHPALAVDRMLDAVAQAADPPGQPRGEEEQADGPEEAHGQDGREQLAELAVAHREHVVRRLLDEHHAAHLALHPDGVRGRKDDGPRVGSETPARGLATRSALSISRPSSL